MNYFPVKISPGKKSGDGEMPVMSVKRREVSVAFKIDGREEGWIEEER